MWLLLLGIVLLKKMKGKIPKFDEINRIKSLLEVPEIDLVLLGDPELGTYNVLKEVNPDAIFLGYDQQDLYKDIKNKIKNGYLKDMEIINGYPYKPEEFHSSILNS